MVFLKGGPGDLSFELFTDTTKCFTVITNVFNVWEIDIYNFLLKLNFNHAKLPSNQSGTII
jgi:hypothetical protein